jgi:hypothetical protein
MFTPGARIGDTFTEIVNKEFGKKSFNKFALDPGTSGCTISFTNQPTPRVIRQGSKPIGFVEPDYQIHIRLCDMIKPNKRRVQSKLLELYSI